MSIRLQCLRRYFVVFSGGGIGGLALATFLATSSKSARSPNIDVHIYEAAPSLTEIGAGVGVWLRTWRILSSAGLSEDMKSIALPPGRDMSENPSKSKLTVNGVQLGKAFEFRRGDRAPEGLSFYTMQVPFGLLTLHRAEFQRVLAGHAIPPAQPHFGKRLVSYEYAIEGEYIILNFADGSSARADLLVGADGIRSPIRREVVRRLVSQYLRELISDATEPVWSGTRVYRSLIPMTALESRFPGHRSGRGPHVLTYPILSTANTSPQANSSGEAIPTSMVNLVAFVSDLTREGTRLPAGEPWVRPALQEEVFDKFIGWEDEVLALLELAKKPSVWSIHTARPLPRYSDALGRVVLVGDAAHAMTPHQGSGGGQAIEVRLDAHVLAVLLTHPQITRETVPSALQAYDAVRVPISQRVARTSRLTGMMYQLNHSWSEEAKDNKQGDSVERMFSEAEVERLHQLTEAIIDIHKWVWEKEPEESQPAQASRLFEEYLKKTTEGRR
ncbi:FAD/NAD-binding domain-containing protein [Fomitiporia mediterranea MF3/22]|uniref:FAD/NAD-binding domain-containing protein n=1 Tax=Fomitiporia mediterranea (strain MF3/22) TaxID=694068 RepID=UPI00044082FE|nr:FAD/NAD-binding domain-containing protein [Fomitiporia mediterranea MF3/22]EJD06331.1 FAD/NAD-binding domain-containing protein [Fomitiporia mediterranea MF3/22]